MLQWEADLPEFHQDGYLPVLDAKLCIDQAYQRNIIKHKYFQKTYVKHQVNPCQFSYADIHQETYPNTRGTQ